MLSICNNYFSTTARIMQNILALSFKKIGDLERARTVDLQRDRLAF